MKHSRLACGLKKSMDFVGRVFQVALIGSAIVGGSWFFGLVVYFPFAILVLKLRPPIELVFWLPTTMGFGGFLLAFGIYKLYEWADYNC